MRPHFVIFLMLSLPLYSFAEQMDDDAAFDEYESFFLYVDEVIKDRESTIETNKCRGARRKLKSKVEEIKSSQKDKRFMNSSTIKNALKTYEKERDSIREIGYSYGDSSRSCSTNKKYKNPSKLISLCLNPENLDLPDFSIMCECLQVSQLDSTWRNSSSGEFSTQTDEMKDNGIKLNANSNGDISLSLSTPVEELPFTETEKKLILREKLYSSIRACVANSDDSAEIRDQLQKKITKEIRPCKSEINRVKGAINKKFSINNYLESNKDLSKVKANMSKLAPFMMNIEKYCYKTNKKIESIVTLFDKIRKPHPNYFVNGYCQDTLEKEKNAFFTTENFLQPGWSTTADGLDITGSKEINKDFKMIRPFMRGSDSILAGEKLGDYDKSANRWRVNPKEVKTLRVGGFSSTDEEEGNSFEPEDYFPNTTAYGKVAYDTDTVNSVDAHKVSADENTSFWRGKLKHLKSKKKKLQYYKDITRTAAFKDVFFACDPKSFIRNFPAMTDHFSVEDACNPGNYSWYSWSGPPEQCKLIDQLHSGDRSDDVDPSQVGERSTGDDSSSGSREQ